MRRARRNPAPHPRIFELYGRLIDAVDTGLRAIVDKNDGSAKVFQPLAKDTKFGSVETEMDLLRTVIGGWPRTGLPYEAAAPRFVEFIAFAYAAERACRAAGETKAADIFAFIRSCPVDASDVAKGYPAKGGVSRVLMVSREMASIKGPSLSPNVHCTLEMLQMEKPLDALAFARSEMWPMGKEKWADGWKAVDAKARVLRPMNCAWRGDDIIKIKVIEGGLLGAGQFISNFKKPYKLGKAKLSKADLRGCLIINATLTDSDLSGSDLRLANLTGSNLSESNLKDANLQGAILNGAHGRFADFSRANLSHADLSSAFMSEANFSNSSLKNADIRNCHFSGSILRGADMSNTNTELAYLIGATREPSDPPIPGTRLVHGRLRHD